MVTNWYKDVSDPILIYHSCLHCYFFYIRTSYIGIIFFWQTSLWGYHWRGGLLMWLRVYQIDLWHDLHHNMYVGSWIILNVCWFLHPLLWRNIDVGFYDFFKSSIISIWWIRIYGELDIPFHVWEQGKQVLLGHSCIHWVAWLYIENHSDFVQWCAWFHQPSDWVILHVISQSVSSLLQLEVYPWRVSFQIIYTLERVVSGILPNFLSLFPDIFE